jgi:hypothetical protein
VWSARRIAFFNLFAMPLVQNYYCTINAVLIYVAGPLVIVAVSRETKTEITDGKLVTSRIGSTIAGLTRIGVSSQCLLESNAGGRTRL